MKVIDGKPEYRGALVRLSVLINVKIEVKSVSLCLSLSGAWR